MPKLNKKYVDDILVMFQSRDHVKKLIDYMNMIIWIRNKLICFTFEIEDQNSFSLLDINIKVLFLWHIKLDC